ncbi:enkurin isoform X2 [Halyomorpha halys]|uniref:enkurin isoform X2 n=1 Tax=Halyomorpha halys TaxID=286706 RepID=UPI0006D4EF0F|nr:enkurin isoform X2 [Halyomorpha halys]
MRASFQLMTAHRAHEGPTETIHNLVFRSEPEEKKFPIYQSKFSKQVREEIKKKKECHKTFGLPKELLVPTPLKKGSRRVVRPEVDKTKPELPPKMKVPTRGEWNQPAQREHSNFLLRNMIKAVRLKPPQGPSRAFDTASGRRYHACNLLMPKFTLREDFGKVPKYLKERKRHLAEEAENRRKQEEERKQIEEETELLSADEEDGFRGSTLSNQERKKREPIFRLVPQEERNELLIGLKKAWEELTKEFKLLPTIVDSVPMVKKKRNLEQILEKIERDIDLLERHQYIYVYKNESPCCKDFKRRQTYL